MASANRLDIETTLIFGHALASSLSGTVSVTIISSMGDSEMIFTALPERTGWVQQA
jgi:hypothetical protein